MPIRALVFDAYGTLFDVHRVTARCDALFPGRGSDLNRLWRQKQLEYTWLRTLMGRYESFEAATAGPLRHACAALQLPLSAESEKALVLDYRRLSTFPEAAAALAGLRDCRLAILFNGSPEMLNALVRHSGLDRLLDHVISVDEIRVFKPHPAVYRLAADRLQVGVEDIGFVSSNYWDACGAASCRLQAYWINRTRAMEDPLGQRPKAVLERLTDLIGLIDD